MNLKIEFNDLSKHIQIKSMHEDSNECQKNSTNLNECLNEEIIEKSSEYSDEFFIIAENYEFELPKGTDQRN